VARHTGHQGAPLTGKRRAIARATTSPGWRGPPGVLSPTSPMPAGFLQLVVLPAEPGALQGWNPTRRIDLAVAAVMAFSAASKVETMTMPAIYW
jgi:hypothetical protein